MRVRFLGLCCEFTLGRFCLIKKEREGFCLLSFYFRLLRMTAIATTRIMTTAAAAIRMVSVGTPPAAGGVGAMVGEGDTGAEVGGGIVVCGGIVGGTDADGALPTATYVVSNELAYEFVPLKVATIWYWPGVDGVHLKPKLPARSVVAVPMSCELPFESMADIVT